MSDNDAPGSIGRAALPDVPKVEAPEDNDDAPVTAEAMSRLTTLVAADKPDVASAVLVLEMLVWLLCVIADASACVLSSEKTLLIEGLKVTVWSFNVNVVTLDNPTGSVRVLVASKSTVWPCELVVALIDSCG